VPKRASAKVSPPVDLRFLARAFPDGVEGLVVETGVARSQLYRFLRGPARSKEDLTTDRCFKEPPADIIEAVAHALGEDSKVRAFATKRELSPAGLLKLWRESSPRDF
jgi:hypothetical protein